MKKAFSIGIDVGGTKIVVGLLDNRDRIIARVKVPTPRAKRPKKIIAVLIQLIDDLLRENEVRKGDLIGIGIGVPGIVERRTGRIVKTPNLNLSGVHLADRIRRRFRVKVIAENDVNLGTLAEKYLGAARKANNVIGIFPGTGMGGGIILNDQLITGSHGAAAELGHMIIDRNGPRCTCGNKGCLEAIASRWAIERDIRTAIKKGQKTVITKLAGKKFTVLKSKLLSKALRKHDKVVTAIVREASEALGLACVSLRHVLDIDLIVLGGGLIKACGDFMVPIVKQIMESDKLLRGFPKCEIVVSKLGDDAIIFGSVILLKQLMGMRLVRLAS